VPLEQELIGSCWLDAAPLLSIESTYSKSKFNLKKNINLKFVISKILSIVFIIATFLLSHINVVFQSNSI